MRSPATWVELFRGLGRSLLGVIQAEVQALLRDLRTSGRTLGAALGLFAGAAAVGVLALGALVLAAYEGLAVALPRWGAALVLAGCLVLIVIVLLLLGRRLLRRVESPAVAARRRLEDHLGWWHERVLGEGEEARERRPEPGG